MFSLSGLVASSVNFPTVATVRKHAHEVHGSATGYVVLTVQCVFNNSYLAIKIHYHAKIMNERLTWQIEQNSQYRGN